MSFINGSQPAGFGGSTPLFAYQNEQDPADAANQQNYRAPQFGDGFRNNPIALPAQNWNPNEGTGSANGYGSSGYAAGGSSDDSFFASIMNSLSNLMSQLSSYFGGTSGVSTTGTGWNGAPSGSSQPETAFSNVSASSTGDPHEALNGTTSAGASVGDKWDSMQSHSDLLDSDSFGGGYRVSTSVTTPNANGVTYNSSATVRTAGGRDAVTLDKDGSYSVTENGRNVTLAQGQATQIGRDETVTLNADKSLTIVDSNHRGGELTTTLSLNGNGVDVKASGSNVDLGGFLVDKTDRDADSPPLSSAPQQPFPYPYGDASYGSRTEPIGAGELEFA